MNLMNLLHGISYKKIYGDTEKEIENISINSKNKLDQSVFIAITGFKEDGHSYAGEAIKNGAVVLVAQRKVRARPEITQVIVDNTREALPLICRNFYGDPTGAFKLIGVTGTNGKTTTCYLIDSILKNSGYRTSMITTVESFLGSRQSSFERTTPESIDLNEFFYKSRAKNIDAACMEISSHSIDLHRVDYLDFDYFLFTNLSQDHLDYHDDMDSYFEVKKNLFIKENRKKYGGIAAIINGDDEYGKKLLRATDLRKISYSLGPSTSDIWAYDITNSIEGIKMDIGMLDGGGFKISSPLCGFFNVYNILAAVSVCTCMGIGPEAIMAGIRLMNGVKGRFEKIDTGSKATVIVDYAHTPDGLDNVLKTLKALVKPGGRLISVFGCGGDRDKKKREIMGYISGCHADRTIITSDNPRSEQPGKIISMIEEGLARSGNVNYIKEPDREKAIVGALDEAGPNDIVLIAGKGHEDYQEFKDHRIAFSDQGIVHDWAGKKK